MLVFIGNLPGDAPLVEIQKLLQGRNVTVDFTSHRCQDWKTRDYHFVLVETYDSESLDSLVEEMNGRLFRGHVLEARPFVKRKGESDWDGIERRVNQLALNF